MDQKEHEYYVTYLHKRDRTPIFDILKWNYYYGFELEKYTINNDKLLCKVNLDPPLKDKYLLTEFSFLGHKCLMIRAGLSQLKPFEQTPLLVKDRLEDVNTKFEDKGSYLEFSTNYIRVLISKKPWQIKLMDNSDEVFFEEYVDGIKRFFPSYPLCIKLLENGEIHFVESIKLRANEAVYGFGERFGPINKRGQNLMMWNSDTTLVSSDRSYKSIPFYVSSRGYGLFIKDSTKISFEVGSEYNYNAISFEVWNDKLEYLVFYGPSFKDIIQMYLELTGKPPIPPLWSFGLWMSRAAYKDQKEVEEVAEKLRFYEVPTDVLHIDPTWLKRYCDFAWNEENFPHPERMLQKLKEMGFKVCLWEQPYVPRDSDMYKEGIKKGFFLKDKDGHVVHIPDAIGRKESAIVDFTNPEAKAWYKEIHKKLLKLGVSVFKCDMGEAIPESSIAYNGKTGAEMHNLYPLYYQEAVFEATKEVHGEGIVWGRAGCSGIQRYPIQWSGDSHTTFEDMACVLRGGLSYSLSGVAFWSHDIGGFQGSKPSPKLYIRWSQWGLLSPFSRCHGTSPREPWEYGDEALRIFKTFVRLRYSLLPYIYSLAHIASSEGIPVARPLILEFQDDPSVRNIDSEYMLGSSLLVVPVLAEDDDVEYYLPQGSWLDWWTKCEVQGGLWIKEKVPLDKIPLYIRENSLIPLTDSVNYVGEKVFNKIFLEAFIKSNASLEYCFDHESFPMIAKRKEDKLIFQLGPSKKEWILNLYQVDVPRYVKINGNIVSNWSHSGKVFQIRFKPSDNNSTFIELGF
ncbi:MAG: alpha-xylosidase [Thermoproteota archaeon]|jgi:alpha-D-xyloside xylohydrolase